MRKLKLAGLGIACCLIALVVAEFFWGGSIHYLPAGTVAPSIVGKDTDGVEFTLEEYRGNIVVLVFSGHWCSPCRAEYPYQRLMLERYEDQPVVLLGINSDAELKTIRKVKIDERLHYRTWWDGHGENPTGGPIATAWRVVGWPAIYVLDPEGVIRHVDERGEQLIATVDEMLVEMDRADLQPETEHE